MKKRLLPALSALCLLALSACYNTGHHPSERPEIRRGAYGQDALPPQGNNGERHGHCHKDKRCEHNMQCVKQCDRSGHREECKEQCIKKAHKQCHKPRQCDKRGNCDKHKHGRMHKSDEGTRKQPERRSHYDGYCPFGEAAKGRC